MNSKYLKLLLLIFVGTFFLSSYIYLLSFYAVNKDDRVQTSNFEQQIRSNQPNSTEKVVRVIDGDTFEITGGIKVRLIGIDTPEMKNKNKTIDCFAQEAKRKLEDTISGKEVLLEKDISETDKYGRLLRYVYVGSNMVNYQLVSEGFARIATFPPDVKYQDYLLAGEKLARASNLGLWATCK